MEPGKFQHSFALFDAEGRLVDWDEGYALEWRLGGKSLHTGITYTELLTAVLKEPQAGEFTAVNYGSPAHEDVIEDQIKGFGTDRVRESRTLTGCIIRIDERRTVAGGV